MFFFKENNHKIIKEWTNTHNKIRELSDEIINTYSSRDMKKVKKLLKEMSSIITNHFMEEDIELHEICEHKERMNENTLNEIKKFKETYPNVKKDMIHFFNICSKKDYKIDSYFFDEYTELIDILKKKISFEEECLYTNLDEV